ncbi:MAG: ABC transporter permease [Spirochaetales bacterium]|nr:ABC transporter permease [Spirochaetales bacterium]
MRILPGDVVLVILGDTPHTLEVREALREELGLNKPLYVQYASWLGSMFNGSFGGRSLETGETIKSLLANQLPVTLLLTTYTLILSVIISVPLGAVIAGRNSVLLDVPFRIISLGGLALPNVWIGSIILLGLLKIFHWSPPIIYDGLLSDPITHMQMMIWPVLILSFEFGSHLYRITRTSVAETLRADYTAAARARGVGGIRLIFKHALPSAGNSILTVIGLQAGTLLGGTLVLESIFGLPGIGRGLVQAARSRDYTVIQSYAALLVFLFLAINLVTDILYMFLDPRTRDSAWADL